MSKRNNLVEFARFLFSVLVVGYHVQMTFCGDATNIFENGALAVEFFFLISGYFMARSIEKIAKQEKYGVCKNSLKFMGGKVKGILPVHITAIIAIIIVILACDFGSAGSLLLNGLPNIFLVQMAVLWNGSYQIALIVPEWYLSAMLLCMLIMVPVALLLRKKIKGVFVTLVLVGILVVILLVGGFAWGWAFPENFIMDIRAWGEMCVGMFAYYLSTVIAKKELKPASSVILKIVELMGYCAPIVLGVIPLSAGLQPVCMAVTVVGVFVAISITFAGKGIIVKNSKLNWVFGYLGSLSLAIYLFHPVIISLLEYINSSLEIWAIYLIVFVAAIALAVIYNLIVLLIKKLIKSIKSRKVSEVEGE